MRTVARPKPLTSERTECHSLSYLLFRSGRRSVRSCSRVTCGAPAPGVVSRDWKTRSRSTFRGLGIVTCAKLSGRRTIGFLPWITALEGRRHPPEPRRRAFWRIRPRKRKKRLEGHLGKQKGRNCVPRFISKTSGACALASAFKSSRLFQDDPAVYCLVMQSMTRLKYADDEGVFDHDASRAGPQGRAPRKEGKPHHE